MKELLSSFHLNSGTLNFIRRTKVGVKHDSESASVQDHTTPKI